MRADPNDRVVSLVALGSRNSDTRHSSDNCILFDYLAKRFLERVQVHTSGLLHDLRDSSLAHLESLECLIFRAKFFLADAETTISEINLRHGVLPFRVVLRVYLAEDLQVC